MLPRLGSSKLVSAWIMATLGASIVATMDGGLLDEWAAFAPARIWRGEVWRLATWVFVERGAVSLVLTCASIYKFGGDLAPRWGDRRLRRFMLEIVGGAALVTLLLALVSEDTWHIHRLGGWAVRDALVIAWARQYPRSTLALYGLLELSGRNLIYVIIGITSAFALFAGPFAMALELAVCAAAVSYPDRWLARRPSDLRECGGRAPGCHVMSTPTPPARSRARRIARELLVIAAFALVLMSARSSLADHYVVPSGSMQPSIEIDDRILVNKAAYGLRVPFTNTYLTRFDGPAVGDVVVLDSPEEDKVLLKRVVGVPGTRIEVRRGRVYLDDKVAPVEQRADGLHELLGAADHAVRLSNGGGPSWGPIAIPEGRYLVMGDNRGDSRDGRFFGLVTREAILGRAVGVFWRAGPTWDGL